MILRHSRTVLAAAALAAVAFTPLAAQDGYRTPPAPIPAILEAPPLPFASVAPTGDRLLLQERSNLPPVAELAEPMLRLAGMRINPATNGSHGATALTGFTLKSLSDGSERRVRVPEDGAYGFGAWAPDGRRVTFTRTTDQGIEQWVADAATGDARRLTGASVNGVAGGCEWMPDSRRLLCMMVPDGRSAPPAEPRVPAGPTIQETRGRKAPVRTYQDLLQDAHDEALFDYYLIAQPTLVDVTTGERAVLGAPAVYDGVEPSPSGEYFLVERIRRPYSYMVPRWVFPRTIEVWDRQGRAVRAIADVPLADAVPIRGVRTGPRSVQWRPLRPASLVWVEALDDGDPDREVEHRDRVLLLDGPFRGEPRELARTGERYGGITWGERGVALLSDFDRSRRWARTWIMDADRAGAARRLLWDRSVEDAYGDPGSPEMRTTEAGNRVLLMDGDRIYLSGDGASPEGHRPFLDRLDLATLRTERLWRSEPGAYEAVVTVLEPSGQRILTRRESRTEPPNYFVRDLRRGQRVALTDFRDPAPQLRGITKQLVVYEREDGVPLNGTLYLPPDHRPGQRLPVVMWAYPREFVSADVAGQVRSSDDRFTTIGGISHLFFLTQGYAVFDGPSMPIVGGDTANNTYIQQLVMSARAAVDKLVEMGVGDRDRMGIGGHSYGAFMTANLLAHSDLFRAGIARSGAYNRTLTPFGFQNETRTFWEAPEIYFAMSPFMHAGDIDEPILMLHGEADNNSGTFPIQSERLFHAINGLGGTARLVMLPHESHGYRARESTMHTLAEMIGWFDTYVKNAPPRGNVTSEP
ncbi:MAG TPA: prolyl oligopeptidase family serine peptidase [Longimicrobiales bacterium]|nr:prolyl oligopeptidase family serine peptidase [Longimicrobiales bacterium]